MAIKRTAPQSTHIVQTTENIIYRWQPSGKPPTPPLKTQNSDILGIKTAWLKQDLLRTLLSTLVVVAILIAIKLVNT